ncbi:FRG domain-containing protein [Catellatospora sp. NPDC049133]|uniref:FRG domain-containing protein n=1 Tax=Catellatospora sp. NPDC049133 TaxID=3155499 RepID=UPI0033FC5A05
MIIEKLSHLAQYVDNPGTERMVFRGQADANWGLVPSIYRGVDPACTEDWGQFIADSERDLFREFSDKSLPHRSSQSAWDILILAQHYGSPTRLIDWTTNAYTALYFAAISSPSTDGAVWCATPSRLPMPPWIGRIHDGLGYRKERLAQFVGELDLPFRLAVSKPVLPPGVTPSARPRFDQSGIPDLSGILAFLAADNSNTRIAAQTGLFSVYFGEARDEVVVDHEDYIRAVESRTGTRMLEKLVVPSAAKPDLLDSLERTGIDARTIFPDLEGLGQYLSRRQRSFVKEIK